MHVDAFARATLKDRVRTPISLLEYQIGKAKESTSGLFATSAAGLAATLNDGRVVLPALCEENVHMMNALYSAATGMAAQQSQMDVIANNLANANTSGFKATRIEFHDLLYQQLGSRQAARLGSQVGMGVAPTRTQMLFSQGELSDSAIPTNMAIEGDGFFQVETNEAGDIAYTRDGSFNVDANGQLVNSSGQRLSPAVVIPSVVDANSLSISPTGRVTGTVQGEETVLGQVEIVRFPNPSGLTALGNNTFAATANSGKAALGQPGADGLGFIRQGSIEDSNVSVMDQMVDMISAQRAFESVAKVMSASDEMIGMANAIRR